MVSRADEARSRSTVRNSPVDVLAVDLVSDGCRDREVYMGIPLGQLSNGCLALYRGEEEVVVDEQGQAL